MTHYQLQFNLTAKTNLSTSPRLLTGHQLNLPTLAKPPKPQPIELPPTPLLDKAGQPILDCPNCHAFHCVHHNGITLQCWLCEQTFYQIHPKDTTNPGLTG